MNIHYSIPKDDMPLEPGSSGGQPEDEAAYRNTSSLFVLVKDVQEATNAEIQKLFSQWGDIKEVRDGRGKHVMFDYYI